MLTALRPSQTLNRKTAGATCTLIASPEVILLPPPIGVIALLYYYNHTAVQGLIIDYEDWVGVNKIPNRGHLPHCGCWAWPTMHSQVFKAKHVIWTLVVKTAISIQIALGTTIAIAVAMMSVPPHMPLNILWMCGCFGCALVLLPVHAAHTSRKCTVTLQHTAMLTVSSDLYIV